MTSSLELKISNFAGVGSHGNEGRDKNVILQVACSQEQRVRGEPSRSLSSGRHMRLPSTTMPGVSRSR